MSYVSRARGGRESEGREKEGRGREEKEEKREGEFSLISLWLLLFVSRKFGVDRKAPNRPRPPTR